MAIAELISEDEESESDTDNGSEEGYIGADMDFADGMQRKERDKIISFNVKIVGCPTLGLRGCVR